MGEKVDNNSTNQNIDTSAAESEGEDGGVVIDDEIVEGKTKEKDDEIVEGRTKEKDDNDNDSKAGAAGEAAGGAALVGAAAAGATALDDKKKKKEKGKSTYKMHIYKDFGDSIKKGAPIEGVFARIVEVKASGQQIERPDLTAGIRLYSGTRGLSVKQVGMMSGYMGAEVSIPNENEQIETAVVCAAYTGAGGSFTQYIHFRAICPRPYISMPDNPTPGYPSIAMLFGDGGTYEQVFILHDFEKPASSISIECDDTRLSIRYETVDAASQTYKLIIQNRSAGDVTPIGSFPIKQGIHITAKNDREFAEEYMLAEFYPEGISVEIDDRLIEDGYYSFYTCKGPSVDYNSPQLAPTLFKVKAAYKDSSGKIVVTTDGIDVAERLTAEDDVSKNVEAKFRYEIKKYQGGAYRFEPGAVVPTTEKDSFIYKLDMRFDSGAHYEYSLPVRLIGEVITQDRLKREDEKRKLKRAIEIVGLTANSYVQQLVREWDQTPTNMLYLIRREVLNEGREFYIRETEYWLDVADKMDKQIVFWSGVRWAVNMAFSIVTRAHFGLACGDYAEAIATPLFDVIIDFVGERMSDKAWKAEPKPIDMTTAIAVVLRMAENYSWATITDGFSLGEQSKAVARVGGLIAAAMGMNFLRAYFFRSSGETYGDFYKSLRQALMDTSINTIKGLFIYGLVGNVYRNADRLRPVFERFIGNHFDVTGQIDRLMNRVCGVAADTLHTSGTAKGVADRLAEGVAYTLGDGVNKVIEWISAYDPEAAQKKQATMQVTGSDGRTAELSYFAILSELVKYICSQLGLDTMFSEERVRAQVNQNLPEEQPYLTQDEIKEGLDQYGIKPV